MTPKMNLTSTSPITRKTFLKTQGVMAATLAASRVPSFSQSPSSTIRVAVLGTNGRGMAHLKSYINLPGVEVAYVCDVDERAVSKGVRAVEQAQDRPVRGLVDFRQALEDKDLDAISIATPNHWHAPATILACSAGKHVYVEKPGSHNPWEAETMVQAAKHHHRVVQMGNQRRSWPWVQETMAKLHDGIIGELHFARSWYTNARTSIGVGTETEVPEWLDYQLWQGPAPDRSFKDNLLHYNWHWHWHWGNGELGNNGIHALDLARWGLRVGHPSNVSCGGGRHYFNDDQETPDTIMVHYGFGSKGASWEAHSCHPRGFDGSGFGVRFQGEKGTVVISGNEARVYDFKGKELEVIKGQWNDQDHFSNFIEAIRGKQKLNSPIDDAQISTQWCHFGNIAYRTGQRIEVDESSGKIKNIDVPQHYYKRTYRAGFEPVI